MAAKVLFICVENSCRSQMAEGFARKLGGDAVDPWSAGSRPSGRVDERAVAAMKERGIDISKQYSKSPRDLPSVRWDYVVTMGCGDACPSVAAVHRIEWDLDDPKTLGPEDFSRICEDIRTRVESLIREAGARESSPKRPGPGA